VGGQLLGAIFGVAAACGWGAGDFCGGAASRRGRVLGVVLASETVGLSLLVVLAVVFSETLPVARDLVWSGVAGIAGTVGLVSFYRAMAAGHIAVAAPVTAMVTAAVPVVVGSFLEGPAGARQFVGFGVALVAVWLVTRTGDGTSTRIRDLGLPFLAGIGFGVFLILIDRVSETATLWPLVASRSASIIALLVVTLAVRPRTAPMRSQLPLAALAGVLDTVGNVCYALSARFGRMDAAAVLSSLGPAITVLLARLFLQESISRRQWLGVAAALAAVALIAP
jgi:drug/metabolite transporter (DMT)-like permease